MQKLAIIGASYLQRPLVEKAKEMNLYTICFAWREGSVCASLCDKYYEVSIIEKDEILRICQIEHIDGICTIGSDVAAPTVAYVAERMGLIGNSYQSAIRANDKFLMRNWLVKAGVMCPQYKMVTSIDQIACLKMRFPIIVKPVDRSGSLGVSKVNTKEGVLSAVEKALSLSFKHEAMIEEYIEGREISVEFISFQGKHYPLQITDKVTTGSPYFVEIEHHQPSIISPEMYDEVYDITRKSLTGLCIMNGASHSEYKITADGEIYVIEIAGRMGGDFIGSHLVQLSTGYDYVKGVINVCMDRFEEPIIVENGCAGVFYICKDSQDKVEVFENEADCFPKDYQIVQKEMLDDNLRNVECSSDRSGYLIYKSTKKRNERNCLL